MVNITKNLELGLNDPLFIPKYLSAQSMNRISDWVKSNRDRRNNLIIFVSSIFLGILATVFVNNSNWVAVLFICNFLMALLIIEANKYNRERNELRKLAKPILEGAKKLGFPLLDVPKQ